MIIHPANPNIIVSEESASLYERILSLTAGSYHWNTLFYKIRPECGLMLHNNVLVYYIHKITGNLGKFSRFNRRTSLDKYTVREPFEIILKDRGLITTKGNVSSLVKALDMLEQTGYRIATSTYMNPVKYKPTSCSFIGKEVNEWVMKGCPDIGVSYKLNINSHTNELCISKLITPNVIINLIGLTDDFIEIIDRKTHESWIITNDPKYSRVRHEGCYIWTSDCYHRESGSLSQHITAELRTEALDRINSIRLALLQC